MAEATASDPGGDVVPYPYVYRWRNNPARARFKDRRCRVVTRGELSTVLLEFENGERLITSGMALRKARPTDG